MYAYRYYLTDITVNPDTESTIQQTDVTVNPDTESTIQQADVTVNPDTESTIQQADVTVNPYTESTIQQADVTKRQEKVVNVMEIPKRFTAKQTVSAAKKKDLLNLCKTGVIPREYNSLYKGLQSDNKTPNILPDPDFEEDEIDSEKEDWKLHQLSSKQIQSNNLGLSVILIQLKGILGRRTIATFITLTDIVNYAFHFPFT
ncbi:Hypothetical predicted protein [Mytilus galloprovincialis]|uniref:Uncharacterized protein n=1 Tax=Mytilus galloprovincialis TaxID=29158 RepID=A0A8B6CYX3_MYTGA|nr:Hypothetical predicted protein [Mytilus galloprovincialis]